MNIDRVRDSLSCLADTRPRDNAAEVTPEPGAYLILLACSEPVPIAIGTLPAATLPPGCYVYAGSARGPGGLRARIARHLRRDKPVHWHIDHLSRSAAARLAYPVAGGDECLLVARLLNTGNFSLPLPGFGSSDCRSCSSHLLFYTAKQPKDRE